MSKNRYEVLVSTKGIQDVAFEEVSLVLYCAVVFGELILFNYIQKISC